MNFNLVEMYNGLLRFNKHILNELAEGLKHLPNLDGVSKGDSLIINEQGNPACVLLLGGCAHHGSRAGSGHFFLLGFGQFLVLMSASLLQLNLIK